MRSARHSARRWLLAGALVATAGSVAGRADEPAPSFEADVLPILARHCHGCHGDGAQEGELDLRTLSEILRGGESGPALVRGDPEASLLVDLVARGQMPPDAAADPQASVAAADLAVLRRWVAAGAPAAEPVVELPPRARITADDRGFWAFQTPTKGALPAVAGAERVRTPIDAFILAQLEDRGLAFSPDAERRALVRRATFDLTGLPPEPEAVEAFAADERPDAYERLIDGLLASPHYGEHWGRHWLDAAGYVDSKLDNDLATFYSSDEAMWRYRDWVVGAVNADLPYDRFLVAQLAGDELVDWRNAERFTSDSVALLTATGFLRTVDDHTNEPQYGVEKRYEVINETIAMVSTALVGLTMDCCRCHNHKYDPLTQRDYYRLMACFEPAYNVAAWKTPRERYLADVAPAERTAIDAHNAALDERLAALQKEDDALRTAAATRLLDGRLAAVPEARREEVRQAVLAAPAARTEAQREALAAFFRELSLDEKTGQVAAADVEGALTDAEREALAARAGQRDALPKEKRSYGRITALWDVGPPPLSRVHRRGAVSAPGVLVQPGFPEVLVAEGAATALPAPAAGAVPAASSGRRLALARWLTDPAHPLTARVHVNRVWHHHFGRGIVATPGNFGRSGSAPTHRELLDWLAADFVEHGWSTKRLHRQIMLSTVYRQASRRPAIVPGPGDAALEDGERIDPANRLLWRMNLRRLEAESVRDAILAVSGALDRSAGGPPVPITAPADGLSEARAEPTPTSPLRRSLYLLARRVYPLKFLELFDAPIMAVNCTERTTSATPLQALALLNGAFVIDQAERMAARVEAGAPDAGRDRIDFAYRLAYGRPPTAAEAERAAAFVAAQAADHRAAGAPGDGARAALADLCHMLLASNEFLHVE